MRVLIDARRLSRRRFDGRATVVRNLLPRIVAQRPDVHCTLCVDGTPLSPALPGARVVVLPSRLARLDTLLNNRVRFARALRQAGADVAFLPSDPYPGTGSNFPSVVLVHNLPMSFYQSYDQKSLRRRRLTEWRLAAEERLFYGTVHAIRHATRIVAVSEYLRQEIADRLSIQPWRIRTAHSGVSEAFHPVTDSDALEHFRREHNLPARYLLALGQKNVLRLLEAYALLPNHVRVEHALVIVGALPCSRSYADETMKRLGIANHVRLVSTAQAEGTLNLYLNLATAFLFPTQFDTFGLPIIEAMKAGCPVLAPSIQAIPEIGGDAVSYIGHPNDVDGLADGIGRLLSDDAYRTELRRRGLSRAKLFSWDSTASTILDVLEEACCPRA